MATESFLATQHKTLLVDITVDEHGDSTDARAIVQIDGEKIGGWGRARRNPVDPRVPRIGDELAIARALNDLSNKIIEAATLEVEQFSSAAVYLHS